MTDDLHPRVAALEKQMPRVAILEKHVEQLRRDQKTLAQLMATRADVANVTDRISKKIDGATSTIVSAVVTAMRGRR
ncbi:MAG TPA: hypothetical protein VMV19_17785 [Xanthobacteraceae bacterium]|nr:hypothetical protein [Xanthobacteraceae bacterium]